MDKHWTEIEVGDHIILPATETEPSQRAEVIDVLKKSQDDIILTVFIYAEDLSEDDDDGLREFGANRYEKYEIIH